MTHAEREQIFLDLFARHRGQIQRLCRGYLGAGADPEDLFQEIMINVWNSLPKFRGDSRHSTWLFRIAVNTALIHRRKRRPTEPLPDLLDRALGVHQDLEQQERLTALHHAISILAPQDRLIVTLLLEGLSYKEISDVTGLTSSYVGVKLTRIKQSLEESITEVFHGAV